MSVSVEDFWVRDADSHYDSAASDYIFSINIFFYISHKKN